jgi:hypothetical protein
MKTQSCFAFVTSSLLLLTLNFQLSTFAQGSLTPPGAPAPTMKTLAQIEPRTPISSAPFTISVPGSYYLTTNLNVTGGDAITITVSGVTLDLSGFTISSTAASAVGNGILLTNALSDILIFNGHIRGGVTNNGSGVYNGPGFNNGIAYASSIPVNTRVSNVSVSGCKAYGILIERGDSQVVESCTVRTVGLQGINASTIRSSSAIDCGGYGIVGDQVSDCRGEASGGGSGVSGIVVQNSYGSSIGSGSGLIAGTAQNCYGQSNTGIGLQVSYTATGCAGSSTSGIGVSAFIANSCNVLNGTTNITHKYNMP